MVKGRPWQIPSFRQPPCDDCPLDRPKHYRDAQQFSGWTHPAWLAPGFSTAAGWPDSTGTPAPLEYWSYTESSSSSSGPGVEQTGKHNSNLGVTSLITTTTTTIVIDWCWASIKRHLLHLNVNVHLLYLVSPREWLRICTGGFGIVYTVYTQHCAKILGIWENAVK